MRVSLVLFALLGAFLVGDSDAEGLDITMEEVATSTLVRSVKESLSRSQRALFHDSEPRPGLPTWFFNYRRVFRRTGLKTCAYLGNGTFPADPQSGDPCLPLGNDYFCMFGEKSCPSSIVTKSLTHPQRRCECSEASGTFTCEEDWPPCSQSMGTISECLATIPYPPPPETCVGFLQCFYEFGGSTQCCDGSTQPNAFCYCTADSRFKCAAIRHPCKNVVCPVVGTPPEVPPVLTACPPTAPEPGTPCDFSEDCAYDEVCCEGGGDCFNTTFAGCGADGFIEPLRAASIICPTPPGVPPVLTACPATTPEPGTPCDFSEDCAYDEFCCEGGGDCFNTTFASCGADGFIEPLRAAAILCPLPVVTVCPDTIPDFGTPCDISEPCEYDEFCCSADDCFNTTTSTCDDGAFAPALAASIICPEPDECPITPPTEGATCNEIFDVTNPCRYDPDFECCGTTVYGDSCACVDGAWTCSGPPPCTTPCPAAPECPPEEAVVTGCSEAAAGLSCDIGIKLCEDDPCSPNPQLVPSGVEFSCACTDTGDWLCAGTGCGAVACEPVDFGLTECPDTVPEAGIPCDIAEPCQYDEICCGEDCVNTTTATCFEGAFLPPVTQNITCPGPDECPLTLPTEGAPCSEALDALNPCFYDPDFECCGTTVYGDTCTCVDGGWSCTGPPLCLAVCPPEPRCPPEDAVVTSCSPEAAGLSCDVGTKLCPDDPCADDPVLVPSGVEFSCECSDAGEWFCFGTGCGAVACEPVDFGLTECPETVPEEGIPCDIPTPCEYDEFCCEDGECVNTTIATCADGAFLPPLSLLVECPGAAVTGSPSSAPVTSAPVMPDATESPTATPTGAPTGSPTGAPTGSPTESPTTSPTGTPSAPPSLRPTRAPVTPAPTMPDATPAPSSPPSPNPTAAPTTPPTGAPTGSPTTAPTDAPTGSPTTAPTGAPTSAPSESTGAPTSSPTKAPTGTPTISPTSAPTSAPIDAATDAPTGSPTVAPTSAPTSAPIDAATDAPTGTPTGAPTSAPTSAPVASMGLPSGAPCGGSETMECADGLVCEDDPSDSCDPAAGDFNCVGVCADEGGAVAVTDPPTSVPASPPDAGDFTLTPDGYNCEELDGGYQVRWQVDGDVINYELFGLITPTQYMGFGRSGEDDMTFMLRSDVTIADISDTGDVRARDYYLFLRNVCNDAGFGVCEDTFAGLADDVTNISGSRRSDDVAVVRYTRPLVGSDAVTEFESTTPISVTPGDLTFVAWAIGPIDTNGQPLFHSERFPRADVTIEFGRPVADNCGPLDTTAFP